MTETPLKIFRADRVHVMNQDSIVNIVTFDTQITTIVSRDDYVADVTPLPRRVELLIHPPFEPEGRISHSSAERQVLEALLDGFTPSELSVGPNHSYLDPPRLDSYAWHPTLCCIALRFDPQTQDSPS